MTIPKIKKLCTDFDNDCIEMTDHEVHSCATGEPCCGRCIHDLEENDPKEVDDGCY